MIPLLVNNKIVGSGTKRSFPLEPCPLNRSLSVLQKFWWFLKRHHDPKWRGNFQIVSLVWLHKPYPVLLWLLSPAAADTSAITKSPPRKFWCDKYKKTFLKHHVEPPDNIYGLISKSQRATRRHLCRLKTFIPRFYLFLDFYFFQDWTTTFKKWPNFISPV